MATKNWPLNPKDMDNKIKFNAVHIITINIYDMLDEEI